MGKELDKAIEEILLKIPRPNYGELPELYQEMDNMVRRIARVIAQSKLYEAEAGIVRFDVADVNDIYNLMKEEPSVMVPLFVMICGFSVRELERLYGIHDVYSLRNPQKFKSNRSNAISLAEAVKENLNYSLYLETIIYKFYKNWEEHQKRHRRAKIEDIVRQLFMKHGYPCGKVSVYCQGKEVEIDAAIPPDLHHMKVACQVRTGVRRDLVKRAKEFSSEFDDVLPCLPDVKFVVIYLVPLHEKSMIDEIRNLIASQREGKRPYDAIVLTWDELNRLIEKFKDWGVSRSKLGNIQANSNCEKLPCF